MRWSIVSTDFAIGGFPARLWMARDRWMLVVLVAPYLWGDAGTCTLALGVVS